MKKIFLSLSLIAALTVGTGAIAFAADGEVATTTNENTTTITQVDEATIDSQDTNTYCQYNKNCPYNGEGCEGSGKCRTDGQGLGRRNCQGGSGNQSLGNGEKRGNCDGTGQRMGFRGGMQK
ncbi:hypothetical protein ACH36K_04370 [Clostridium sp. MB05]|uniref:hypothetical protein n=1 Tax=Clostridium sp. MB05 TaxID=3376682 RepID=UPI003981BD5E